MPLNSLKKTYRIGVCAPPTIQKQLVEKIHSILPNAAVELCDSVGSPHPDLLNNDLVFVYDPSGAWLKYAQENIATVPRSMPVVVLIDAYYNPSKAREMVQAGYYEYLSIDELQRIPVIIASTILHNRKVKFYEDTIDILKLEAEKWDGITRAPFQYVCLLNRDGEFQYSNNRLLEQLREGDKEVRFQDVVAENCRDKVQAALDFVFNKGESTFLEIKIPRFDKVFASILSPVIHGGEVLYAVVQSRDITPDFQKRIELEHESTLNNQLIELMEDGLLVMDEHGIVKRANPPMKAILQTSKEDVQGVHIAKVIPRVSDKVLEILKRNIQKNPGRSYLFRKNRGKYSEFFLVTPFLLPGERDDAYEIAATFKNITKLHKEKEKIAQELHFERTVSLLARRFFSITNETYKRYFASSLLRVKDYFGAVAAHLVTYSADGQLVTVMVSDNDVQGLPEKKDYYRFSFFRKLTGGGDVNIFTSRDHLPDEFESRLFMKDRFYPFIEISLRTPKENFGFMIFYFKKPEKLYTVLKYRLNLIRNMFLLTMEKLSVDRQQRHLALYDSLTGLCNRFFFAEQLSKEIEIAKRHNSKFAVLFLDLDHFKEINDVYGHAVGDNLLIAVAARLLGSVRKSDLVARQSGDEFVILLRDIQSIINLREISRKILEAVSAPLRIERDEIHITCSVGAAVFPDNGTTVVDLMAAADQAMYTVKKTSRNYFRIQTDNLEASKSTKLKVASQLKKAIDADELEVYYQPQVSLVTNRVVGVEALARWTHEGEFISPAVFIPTAEEAGLINALTEKIMRRSIRQISQAEKELGVPLRLGINLSAKQFHDKNYPAQLSALVKEENVTGGIELEITETSFFENLETARAVANSFHESGFGIAIDDMGAGYNSLVFLTELPISTLKIDRSLIIRMMNDFKSLAIVRNLIRMTRELKMDLVVEGVENLEEVQLLSEMGADIIQGFYFSKPLPFTQLIQFVKDFHAVNLDA